MKPDPAILSLLNLDPKTTTLSPAGSGGSSSATTSKLTTTLPNGTPKSYFLKTSQSPSAKTMFAGEHASLTALSTAVPTLCPKPLGHGTFTSNPSTAFLITDYLEPCPSPPRLAKNLAKLHSAPAPIPAGYTKPQFGFPVTTCCGDTPQPNTFSPSWPDFYANQRLRFIISHAPKQPDAELTALVEQTCNSVVPRLLGHLNITPVVVHGDLWSGNTLTGKLPGMSQPEAVVFDPSACYAHSEFELGIMQMFGGFGAMMREYHELVPKTEPVEEYEDRVRLYELYHHLNHYAMFGGGYRSGAMEIMRELVGKYGGRS